jgi:hypothetical protein
MKMSKTTGLICAALLFLLVTGMTASAGDGDLKLEAQLILCSNDPQPEGKAVAPDIEQKLKRLPLKWQHYSIVSAQNFSVARNESKSVVLGKTAIAVKNLGGEKVEVTVVGHGKITQSLRKGQTLMTNSNDDACLIMVRQVTNVN